MIIEVNICISICVFFCLLLFDVCFLGLFVNISLGIIVILYIFLGFDDMFGMGILFVASNFVVVISILIYYDSHLEMNCFDRDKATITIILGFFLFVSTILDIVSLIYFRESIIATNKEAFNYIMFGVCVTYTIIKPTVFVALKLNRYSNTFWDEFMNRFAKLPVLSVLLFVNGLLYSLSLLSVSMEFGLLFYLSNPLFIVIQCSVIFYGTMLNEKEQRIFMCIVVLMIVVDLISISLYSKFLSPYVYIYIIQIHLCVTHSMYSVEYRFKITLASLLLTLKVVHIVSYYCLFGKWKSERKSNDLQQSIAPEPIIEDPTKQEIKESYESVDSDGWISLQMRCPVQECIDLNDNIVYYWKHPGGNSSQAQSQLPDVYPIQINSNGQMRCGGCKGSTVKDYSEYVWEGCSTHSGAKKGKDGYLMEFIRENNIFNS